MKHKTVAAVILIAMLLLSACGQWATPQPLSTMESAALYPNSEKDEFQKKQSNELTVWSYYDMTEANRAFEAANPGVKINSRVIPYNSVPAEYTQASLTDQPPDVMIFGGRMIGYFNGNDILDNLHTTTYSSSEYYEAMPANMQGYYSSFGGGEWIALPMQLESALTFYRADLLEENGFPSEPEQLAAYLEDPARWIEMAKELKEKDIYLFQYYTDPIDISDTSYSLFDHQLQFNRNNSAYLEAFQVAREVRKLGLALRSSIHDSSGQAALRNGQLAMVYLGSWAGQSLKEWAPQGAGLWKATRLPMGIHGIHDGSAGAISYKSPNKELAWEYLKAQTNLLEQAEDLSVVEYLGGQSLRQLVEDTAAQLGQHTPSPVDINVEDLWKRQIINIIESDSPIDMQLHELSLQLELVTQADREALKNYLNLQ